MGRLGMMLSAVLLFSGWLPAQVDPAQPKLISFETDAGLLEKWPGRVGRAASRRLAARGPEVSEKLLKLLEHRDWRYRAGAANALSLIGDPRAFAPLQRALSDVGNRIGLETYFQALVRLDPIRGTAEVLPFLKSPSPRISRAAYDALPDRIPASFQGEISKLWTHRSQAVRLWGLELSLKLETPPSRDEFLRFLGDRNPKICRRVADFLSRDESNEAVGDLNRLVREGGLRQASYAVIALVLMEDRTSSRFIAATPKTLKRLRRFLQIRGGLERAAGAIALSNLSMHSEDQDLRKLADERLMFHLIDSMAGGVIFKDYGAVRDVCLRKATMLSGVNFGDDSAKWRRWWIENEKVFLARRDLASLGSVVPESLLIEVDWSQKALGSRYRFSGGDGADVEPRMPRHQFLNRDQMRILMERIKSSRLMQEEGLPTAEGAVVTVRLKARRAEMLKRFGAQRTHAIDELLGFMSELSRTLSWQSYWSPRKDGRFQDFLQAWRARPDHERSSGELAKRALMSFPELGATGRKRALALLAEQSREWIDAHRDELLSAMKAGSKTSTQLKTWTGILLRGAGEPEVKSLIDAVAVRGATCTDVVRDLLKHLPMEAMKACREDKRSIVRAAVVPILLSSNSGTGGVTLVRELLMDPAPLVREALSTAARKHADFRTMLMSEVQNAGVDRKPALEILGASGADEVVPFLGERLDKSELTVALGVISSLAAIGSDAALDILFAKVESWDDDVLSGSALGALGEDARPEVRKRMRSLLKRTTSRDALLRLVQVASGLLADTIEEDFKQIITHEDAIVRRRAAELMADHGGTSAIPVLITFLSNPTLLESTRTRLELITCFAVSVADAKATREAYQQWWEAHSGEKPAQWFLAALQKQGGLRGDLRGVLLNGRSDPTALKQLVEIIAGSDRWYLRVRAHRALNRIRGKPMRPVLRRHSTPQDQTLAVKRWREWLDRFAAGLDSR